MTKSEVTPPAHFEPRKINEDNIPYMLRDLANRIERGLMPVPKTLFIVGLYGGGDEPTLDHFGQLGNRMEEVGALTIATHWHMRDTGDDDDD